MTYSGKQLLDGADLRDMFAASVRLFEGHVDEVNALNVFPVPDGDTGTNMLLTLREVVKATDSADVTCAGEMASVMARGSLMGARGNSGVILSQFFKGLAQGLEGISEFGASHLAMALQRASEQARTAVGEPVEGTMLTVMRDVAAAGADSAGSGDRVASLFDAVCEAARATVARTPTMLSVLREAGVVDAGGYGFYLMLEGARRYLAGAETGSDRVEVPEPIGVLAGPRGATGEVSATFLAAADRLAYGYCTQFLVEGRGLNPDAVRNAIVSMAESVVVVGDESLVKVHAHAADPAPITGYGESLGTVSQVSVVSMDEQHREYSRIRREVAGTEGRRADSVGVAVVAVVLGHGLEGVFRELGASVLRAGDTMNPSVQEIVDAIEYAPSNEVLVLPNNKNVAPAAVQAAGLTEKTVRVVPSTSLPQGVAALLAFNPEDEMEASASSMEQALATVRTGEVTRAVRPTVLNGVPVDEGQLIGLVERQLVVAGDDPCEVLLAVLSRAEVSEGDLVTLYWGDSVDIEDAREAGQSVADAFPAAELELVRGDQPHYDYIVSIE